MKHKLMCMAAVGFLALNSFATMAESALVSGGNWTEWLDRDDPSGNADAEILSNFLQEKPGAVCQQPTAIEARYSTPSGWVVINPSTASSAPNIIRAFSPTVGLACFNADQTNGKPSCQDYHVRFLCGGREDLSLRYPFLKDVDAKNAAYAKTTPGFSGRNQVNIARTKTASLANAKTTGTADIVEEHTFHLGQGFDTINSVYRNECLNQDDPNFKISSDVSNIGTNYSVKHIKSQVELYESLDSSFGLSATTGFSIDGVDITAGLDLTNDIVKAEYLDESHEVFVAKYTNMKKRYTLQTQPRPIRDEFVGNMLINGNVLVKHRDYFSECGDRYVDGVELGANLYVVFYFDTKLIKESEKQNATTAVSGAVSTVFAGKLTDNQKELITRTFSKYNVKFDVYGLGGPDIVHTFTNPTTFNDYLNQFATGINDANIKAVKETFREYTLPTALANENYFSVFADTALYINYAGKYTALMNEYEGRCNQAKEYNAVLGAHFDLKSCSNGGLKQDIQSGRHDCGVSQRWDKCIHPGLYRLFDSSLLLDKLTANTPAFSSLNKISDAVQKSVTGGLWNKKCIDSYDAAEFCLPVGCHEDKPESDNYRGYKYHEISYSSPANSDEQGSKNDYIYTNSSGQRCARADIKACTRRIGGSKANFQYRLQLWGVCPISSSFNIF
jgi:hypothetical protein